MRETAPNSPYRLLVFDWDGTLLDSISSILACTQAALARIDLPIADESDIRASIGMGIREMVERFYPGCSDADFQRLVLAYRELWFDDYCHRSGLLPGAVETLTALADRGYWLAVATAKSRRGLDLDLDRTGVRDRFLSTRTADESRAKPDPAMLESILQELGVEAADALMIGDTSHDLQMAQNARTDGLGVLSGSQSRGELEACAPKSVLDGVWDMPAWLATLPA